MLQLLRMNVQLATYIFCTFGIRVPLPLPQFATMQFAA